MRILIMTDSLLLPTGQGRVGKEIALGLKKRGHDIGYIGWFHHPSVLPNAPEGIRFWWTYNNEYGADILDDVVRNFRPDMLLTIGDFWNIDYIVNEGICKTRKSFLWCSYIPVDGEPIGGGLPPGIIKVVEDIDIPVAYTEYAKNAVLKSCMDQETSNRIRVIYHGVDTNIFKPSKFEERKKIRQEYGLDDKFVFLTVARNQSRKNIPELLRAWKEFSELPETSGKVILWPHMFFNDSQGWKIDDLLDILHLRNQSIMYYQQVAYSGSESFLIPDEKLAQLYQIVDAFVLVSGEGFGLPTFEAMATGLPCILLNSAASSEIGADGRAELVKSKGSITWTGKHLTQRPIPDPEDIVKSCLRIFKDGAYRHEIAKKGQEFSFRYTWDKVLDEWNALIMSYENHHMYSRKLEVVS